MPRGRRVIEGPLSPLANSRKQFEKNFPRVVQMIRHELGNVTRVPRSSKPVHFGSNLRLDLQKPPYQRDGVWWANYAVQTDSRVHGSLEVECDVDFPRGDVAEAMIEACGNASASEQRGSKWVVTAEYQYVLFQTKQPHGVFKL